MNRIPGILVGLAGLGLVLTACVPLDVPPADPTASSSPAEPALPPSAAASSKVPDFALQTSTADGLEQRIGALHEYSIANQLQQGKHPIDNAVQGSERVVLAERFSQSTSFELSEGHSGDSIVVEMTCAKSVNMRFEAYDAEGRTLGGGQLSGCSPDGPSGFGFGTSKNQQVRQIRVAINPETDMELSAVVFTSAQQDPPAGN